MRHGLLSLVVLLGLAAPAAAQVTIEYYHLDPVGSVHMVTDASGDVTQRYDYQVFGKEPSAGGQPRKYAGKDRDPETGYDYFGRRYYANRLGRFTTVDPAYRVDENLLDPQRWNRLGRTPEPRGGTLVTSVVSPYSIRWPGSRREHRACRARPSNDEGRSNRSRRAP